jgi:hypothetical protein
MLATFCYTVHTGAELGSGASDFYVADMEDPRFWMVISSA